MISGFAGDPVYFGFPANPYLKNAAEQSSI
jgi:hypothetical protein